MTETEHAETLSKESVLAYIKTRPELILESPEIIEALELSSQKQGAISLAERQIQTLRDSNKKLKEEMQRFVRHARENETLLNQTFELCLKLLGCEDKSCLDETLSTLGLKHFGIPQIRLFYMAEPWRKPDEPDLENFRQALGNNLPKKQAITGRLRQAERDFIFGEDHQVASLALIPLGDGCEDGLLALGSPDEHHFDPHKGDLFLGLLAKALCLWLERQN